MDRETAPAWPHRLNVAGFLITITALGLALALGAGGDRAIAEDEARALAPRPAASWGAVVDGSYMESVEAYIADHFPLRGQFLAAHFWLAERRGIRDPRVAFYDVEVAEGGERAAGAGWEGDPPPDPAGDDAAWASALAGELDVDGGDATDGDDADEAAAWDGEAEPSGPAAPHEARRSGGILVVDGRAMQLFTGGPLGARAYARAVNAYEEALRGRVRVYSLIVPTAQTFYLPAEYDRFARPEPPNIAATYARMNPGVTTVDVVEALRPHAGEYIYFRGDHHWTALGAYYAYRALCAAAGLEPLELAAMERRRKDGFRGSLYRFTRDSALGAAPDHVEYWLPPGEVKVARYGAEMVRTPIHGPLIRERGAHYGVFLGGDFPLIVARTGVNPGRRALLIKNSYGNPFAVFLAAHFEETLIVDYRYFNGSVLELIKEHEVTDLILLNGTITANARFHAARVGWIMDGGKRSRRERRAAAAAGERGGE